MADKRPLHHLEVTRHGAEHSAKLRILFRLALWLGLFLLLAPRGAQARRWAVPQAPGQWRIVDESKLSSKQGVEPTSFSTTYSYTFNRIAWNVTYYDPAGEGFNDPVKGADRRGAVASAMETISNNMFYTTGTLDVVFNPSSSATGDVLAFADTSFPTAPNGFYNGMAYEHINTGVDPSPTLPDIYCTVNFNYPFYAGTGQPAGNEYDLQSILLHEFTHGMGLISLAAADGTSRINSQSPGIFSVWDSMLKTPAEVSLWTAGGVFAGTPAQLAGTPGIIFSGSIARFCNQDTYPYVYTPAKFEAGSSLSHWDTTVSNTIMEPGIDLGEVKRAYGELDRAALRDIGWRIHTSPVTGVRSGWGLYE